MTIGAPATCVMLHIAEGGVGVPSIMFVVFRTLVTTVSRTMCGLAAALLFMLMNSGVRVMASRVRATIGLLANGHMVRTVLVPAPWTTVVLAANVNERSRWFRMATLEA